MNLCRKAFLLFAGTISIAFDELSSAVDEAAASVEEKYSKVDKRLRQPSSKTERQN